MPNFVGCLIGFHSRLVVSFTGSKCGRASQLRLSIALLVCLFGIFGFKTCVVAEGLYFVVVGILAET